MRERPTSPALESVWDDIDGVRVHARVSAGHVASVVPIVFVPGLGVSITYMEPTMALLARRHQVAGLDLPGFGRSGTPRRAYDLRELAGALGRWLDVRGIARAVFVGNSFGCQVIVELVTREPARAAGLVLNAPTMDPAHRTVLGQLGRVLADIPREHVSLSLLVASDYLRAGPFRLLATLRTALGDRIEEKLPAILAPTSVVCGGRDLLVTAQWADQVARLVGRDRADAAGATLDVVANGAHALPYDDPDTFSALIVALASRARVRMAL